MTRLLFQCILLAGLLFASCSQKKDSHSIPPIEVIPQPAQVKANNEYFIIDKGTKVLVDSNNPAATQIANMFIDRFASASGITLETAKSGNAVNNAILFNLRDTISSGVEGYALKVGEAQVTVTSSTEAGLFYGMQTVLSLLPAEAKADTPWIIPGCSIEDAPRFSWRGLHLDVCRHFVPVAFIKDYLDYMAMHKLNTFHWHLTDDQGWRIEIKQYPKLTSIGAWREKTLAGRPEDTPRRYDGKKHGGYYTQEEIKEVVAYAADRYITIVPEIEMPGHASAAVASYPELGVTGKQIDVVSSWGVFPDLFNVEDETFTFLENVLSEVIALFPGKYIHIGGDEAMKDQWEASETIQNKIKELGLKDEHELQSYFITRIEKFVNSKGRQIIGWDEILEGGLAPNAAVMSWRGEAGGIAAAKSKHYVVMTPASHMYFDHYQGDPAFEPMAFGGYAPIEKVYNYEPIPDTLSQEESKYIMGAQANLWSEYIPSTDHIEYMLFPRINALAEMLWSPKDKRDWSTFKEKLPKQLAKYERMGINYAKSIYKVTYEESYDSTTNTLSVKLKNQLGMPDIYYTLDSSKNYEDYTLYETPIVVKDNTSITAVTIKEGKPLAAATSKTFDPTEIKTDE